MRIDLNANSPEIRDTGKPARGNVAKTSSAPESQVKDEARLSSNATRIDALEKQINQLPDIRAGKVEPLRAAVQGGSYQVNAEQIADAMFSAMILWR